MKKLLFLFVIPFILFSKEDESKIFYGIFLGYGLNNHIADFKKLPDCPSCSPGYKDGSGNGLNFGIVWDLPLSSSIYLSNRLIYRNISGNLISTEKTTIIADGTPTEGEFEHSLDATLGIIGLEPHLKINLFDNFHINGGANISYLLTKDYAQVEKITKPTDYGTFLNPDGTDSQSRERNKFSGTMQEANAIFMAPFVSISYLIPLDKRSVFLLEPEISYHLGLTNIVNDQLVNKWKVNTLTFGLSLKYSPPKPLPKEEKYYERYEIDTIKVETDVIAQIYSKGQEKSRIEKNETETEIITTKFINRTDTIFTKRIYALNGAIKIVGVDDLGNEIPNPVFKVKEVISNRLDPLLNYIFFDDNSSQIPDRYIRLNQIEVMEFQIEKLFYDSTIQIYHNILNIIGKRMIDNLTAKITLIGCNSDYGLEKGNTELSRKRAEEVKTYLTTAWDISPYRINIETRNLPQKASTPTNEPDKIAENRRVEIISDNEKITEPIFIEKIDRIANPPIARFKLEAQSEVGLAKWSLEGYQNSDKINRFKMEETGEIKAQVDWVLAQYQKITPKFPEPIIGELNLEDKKGNTKQIKTQSQPIEVIKISDTLIKREGDYKLEKFSLILFDFDKATIENQNQRIIDFIKSRINTESEIEIIGYTDRTGNPEYNKGLSERRANATVEALKRRDAKATGLGQEKLLYDNELPEGRFYCRTVEIIVRTKIK